MTAAVAARTARSADVPMLATLVAQLGYPVDGDDVARRFALVERSEQRQPARFLKTLRTSHDA